MDGVGYEAWIVSEDEGCCRKVEECLYQHFESFLLLALVKPTASRTGQPAAPRS